MVEGHVVWWIQIYMVPEGIGVRREAEEAFSVSTGSGWGLLWPGVAAVAHNWPKQWGQLTWRYWMTRYSINSGFLPWWHRHIPRWRCQDSSGSNCNRTFQSLRPHFHTWIRHHRVQIWTPLSIFGTCCSNFTQCSSSPIINTRYWWKMNATLDGNQSFGAPSKY